MSSKTGVKIFIKKNGILLDFMWADVTPDGSVIMGLYGSPFISTVEKIFDKNGELKPDEDFLSINSNENNNTKITFHATGRYKFTQMIKKMATDRITVNGSPFSSIKQPTRMLEIILPLAMKESSKTPREGKDQIIDITHFPNKPLRCTVVAMPINEKNSFGQRQVVDTSEAEAFCIFEHNNLAWAWIIRVSVNDKQAHNTKFYVFLNGKIAWPSIFRGIINCIQSFFRSIKKRR